MAVLVLGAGGFVGGQIAGFLRKDGLQTFTVSRNASLGPTGQNFQVGSDGEFETDRLLDFVLEKKIEHFVHCANKYSPNPSFSVANQMLSVNYLLPARVLRVAIEASAKSFINVASAWQVTDGRLEAAPDYVSSKESFRQYLECNADRIRVQSLFVNEVFGAADPRKKLINQAFRSAIDKEIFKVKSEGSQLGLVYLPRLASEISGLISANPERPPTYVYENYSLIPVGELMETIASLLGVGKFWEGLGLDAAPTPVISLPKFGQCNRADLSRDLAGLVQSIPRLSHGEK